MFNHKHYVPILKSKRAEFPALEHLRSHAGLTPLIECIPGAIPQTTPRKMSAFWPVAKAYFIDADFLDDEGGVEADGPTHPISVCFAEVAAKGQNAIPVTGTARSQAYQAAVRRICAEQGKGVSIRLVPDDFEDEDVLATAIDNLVTYLGVDRRSIDIVIDLDTVAETPAATVAQTERSNIDLLPHLMEWRTLTVASGAFPLGISTLTRGVWNTLPRTDWLAWHALISGGRRPRRLPAYGDYAIAHPNLPPTGHATILAQLRYSLAGVFFVWKGHNAFTHANGFDQFLDICADLVTKTEYRGPAFSWGDAEIQVKATTRDSPGNAEIWRRIGTSHHLETVLEQIANLP